MRTVVAVLRGGPSSEYDLSLKSGANVLEHLDKEKYEPRDLFISKRGEWHLHGAPVSPERAVRGVDVAINMVHGQYGEDGQLQKILEALSVPQTGPRAAAAARSFDKQAAKESVAARGVKVVHGSVINREKITDIHQTALNIFRSMPHPLIIKPVIGGSSVGLTKVEGFQALEPALHNAFSISPRVLIEEFVPGREATVGIIDNFRNEKLYALLPAELTAADIYVPSRFSPDIKEELQRAARLAHEALGLRHYSRSDFIVSRRGVYYIETDSISDLTPTSEFVYMLHAVGANLSHFLDHIISVAKRSHA